MPKYVVEVNDFVEGVKGILAKGGSARCDAAKANAESVGATVEAFYVAFGNNDAYVIIDVPDDANRRRPWRTVPRRGGMSARRCSRSSETSIAPD
jgi:uncharacterized protein with GYD domain